MRPRISILSQFFNKSQTRRSRGRVVAGKSGSPSSSLGQYNLFDDLAFIHREIDSTIPFVLRVAFPDKCTANTLYKAQLDLPLRQLLYETIVRALHLLTGAPASQLTLWVTSSTGRRANVWYLSCSTVSVSVRQLYQLSLFACQALARGAAADLLEKYLPGNTFNWFDAIDVARLLDEGYVAPWAVGTVNKLFVEGHGGLEFAGNYVTTRVQPSNSWLQPLPGEVMPRVNHIHLTWNFMETIKTSTEPLSDRTLARLRENYHLRIGLQRDWFQDFTPLTSPALCAALAAEFELSLGFRPLRAFMWPTLGILLLSANHGGSRDFLVLDTDGLWLRTLPAHPDDQFEDSYCKDLVQSLHQLQNDSSATPGACGFEMIVGTEGLLAEVRELWQIITYGSHEKVNGDLHSSGLVSYQLFRRACERRGRSTLFKHIEADGGLFRQTKRAKLA